MELKKCIATATAVKINGSLASTYNLYGEYGFVAKWDTGAQHTYDDTAIADAKYHNGVFIISNDVVEFYTLESLNPTH